MRGSPIGAQGAQDRATRRCAKRRSRAALERPARAVGPLRAARTRWSGTRAQGKGGREAGCASSGLSERSFQFVHVMADGVGLALQEAVDRLTEFGVLQPVPGMHGGGNQPARELVLALRAALEYL